MTPRPPLVELVSQLRALLEGVRLDAKWVKRLRATWAKLCKPVDQLKAPTRGPVSYEVALAFNAKMQAVVQPLMQWVLRLQDDVLLNKDVFSARMDSWRSKEQLGVWAGIARTIVHGFQLTRTALIHAKSAADLDEVMEPKAGHFRDALTDKERFFFLLQRALNNVKLYVVDANNALEANVFVPLDQATAAGPVTLPDVVELEVSIGHAKLVFPEIRQAYPGDPWDGPGSMQKKLSWDRETYVKQCQIAKALLEKHKLGFLWYGEILVHHANREPSALYRQRGGDYANISAVAATYERAADRVNVYEHAGPSLHATLIHELGHRYYYKFLTDLGREQFDKWFGKVAASSEYGGTNTVEDFAEVFKAYVVGHDLTSDQVERFKTVLNPKAKRTEARLRFA
jgi:hypothetical protein